MTVKRKQQCCRIKDHSPLGLLGILLITVGVIIAIFDAKDTLPNATEPYVLAIGILLIILGVVSIVLAFMGYRRLRATARQTTGSKHIGGRGRRDVAAEREAMALPPKYSHQPSSIPERTDNISGPALVALPGCYKVVLPTDSKQYISKIGGQDNYAFQQTPGKVLSCESLLNGQNIWEYQMETSPPDRPERADQNHIHRIQVVQQDRDVGKTYTPRLTQWANTDVAKYIPPVSTIV